MLIIKRKTSLRWLDVFCLLAVLLFLPRLAAKAEMSSTNYKIPADTVSLGGDRSTSSNFIVEDTVGEVATGAGATSSNYKLCAGAQCLMAGSYLSFSVKEGTSSPGTVGADVALGEISPSSVTTSGGSINSIFITADSSADSTSITVRSDNAALKSVSVPTDTIDSSSANPLVAGTAGYGVCVFSATNLTPQPAYYAGVGTCTKDTGHVIGKADMTAQPILTTSGQLIGGTAEILVKAAVSETVAAHDDYQDTLTFVLSGTY